MHTGMSMPVLIEYLEKSLKEYDSRFQPAPSGLLPRTAAMELYLEKTDKHVFGNLDERVKNDPAFQFAPSGLVPHIVAMELHLGQTRKIALKPLRERMLDIGRVITLKVKRRVKRMRRLATMLGSHNNNPLPEEIPLPSQRLRTRTSSGA
jgi:hypothetical protein